MSDMTLSGVALDKARSTKSTYKSIFGLILAFELIIALALLFIPHYVLDILGMTHIGAEMWLQLLAGIWLILLLYQFAARRQPLLSRYPNIINVIGRFGLAILLVCVGGYFLYGAIYFLVTALILYILFRRMIIGELQTRP